MGEAGMSDWHIFPDRHGLDQALATEVLQRLERALEDRGTAFLVVSGGSTPAGLFSMLARAAIDWSRVTVMLADERWVDAGHDDSNERRVRSTLLKGPAADAQFLTLIPKPGDAESNIAQLSETVNALPRFDVVLLGMGEDAHTASLFPCAKELEEGLTTTEGALMTRPSTAPYQRVSLSRRRLQHTECGMVHIVGEAKRSVLQRAEQNPDPLQHPVSAFLGARGFDCWWSP